MKTPLFHYQVLAVITVAILTIAVLAGCKPTPPTPAPPKATRLYLMLDDNSISKKDFALLNTSHVREATTRIATTGGGTLYLLHVVTVGDTQDIRRFIIPALDTLPLHGNPYQQKRIARKNAATRSAFNLTIARLADSIAAAFIRPKNEPYSDVSAALKLAKNICESPAYSNAQKCFICISDMENDRPGTTETDPLKDPIVFAPDVRITLVRPDAAIMEQTPPVCGSITTVQTIEDAILNIK